MTKNRIDGCETSQTTLEVALKFKQTTSNSPPFSRTVVSAKHMHCSVTDSLRSYSELNEVLVQ